MFRFTIRDVLWLTVVAALAVGWWLDHRQLSVSYSMWNEQVTEAVNDTIQAMESPATHKRP